MGPAAARRPAARALRRLREGGGGGGRVRQGAPRRDALHGLLARRQGAAEREEGESVGAAAARLEERSRVARQVVRRRRGRGRSEEGPDDLPLLRPRDALPGVRKDQCTRGRGGRGVVAPGSVGGSLTRTLGVGGGMPMRKALTNERLEPLIFGVRGHRVLLDADLARLY